LMIGALLRDNRGLVEERGEGAFGVLMGLVMERVRGRVEAGSVSEILRRHLNEFVGG